MRWHSPRDWIEDANGDGGGHLSARMETLDNFWRETWLSAKSVPVTRQKRLFNESKEAEKVANYLQYIV